MKKSRKLVSRVANSNIAIDSLPTLQISVWIAALFEKIYDGLPILTVFSNIGEDVLYITVVSIQCMMWKVCRSPKLCRYLQTIIECKWHKQALLSSFRPPTRWGFIENEWWTTSTLTVALPPSMLNYSLSFKGSDQWKMRGVEKLVSVRRCYRTVAFDVCLHFNFVVVFSPTNFRFPFCKDQLIGDWYENRLGAPNC